MPTKDYDPIGEIIEAIGARHIWPVTKITTDTKGNITIGPGNTDDYVAVKYSSISTRNPESAFTTKKEPADPFAIRSVLSNRKKNAFSVVWMDGTTTVVHCQSGDDWDDEKALAMCFTTKALGNKGNFNDKFNDALDNKMKVIPAEPAPEKACDCDGTCTECKCKEELKANETLTKLVDEVVKMNDPVEIGKSFKAVSKKMEDARNSFGINTQTATELGKAATKASNSLKEMIDALTGETVAVDVKPVNIYKVFVRISGKSHYDSEHFTIESLRARVHEIAEELYGKKPYYYRTWMNGDRMMVDFGHYTQFIEIEGITPDEYAKH